MLGNISSYFMIGQIRTGVFTIGNVRSCWSRLGQDSTG
jgi:hypothetical protein